MPHGERRAKRLVICARWWTVDGKQLETDRDQASITKIDKAEYGKLHMEPAWGQEDWLALTPSRHPDAHQESGSDHTANSLPLGSVKWNRRPPGKEKIGLTTSPPAA